MTRWLYLAITLTVAALAGSAYVYLFAFDRLPEQVPVHWGINGTPDKWVPRSEAWVNFWLMPAVMAGFTLLTVVLPWMSPKNFKVDQFRDTYGYVMAVVVALFAYIHLLIIWGSFEPTVQEGRWLIAGILFFFALLGNVLGQIRRNFWVGVRTPWTLANETVWNATHRLAAWMFTGFGIIGCIIALAGAPLWWCFVPLIIVALVPVVYSLILYKLLEKQGKI